MRARRVDTDLSLDSSRGRLGVSARAKTVTGSSTRTGGVGGVVSGQLRRTAERLANSAAQKATGGVRGDQEERFARARIADSVGATGKVMKKVPGARHIPGVNALSNVRGSGSGGDQEEQHTKTATRYGAKASKQATKYGYRGSKVAVKYGYRAGKFATRHGINATRAAGRAAAPAARAAASRSTVLAARTAAATRQAVTVVVRAVVAVIAKIMAWPVIVSVMAVLLVAILIAAMLSVVAGIASTADCGTGTGGTVNTQTAAKRGEATGLTSEQLVNAAHIMNAGSKLGLSVRDQQIGVMTALGESGLRILSYGDQAGPDSRGLFQQRDNWGPLAGRMNGEKGATLFFQAMIQKVPEAERQTLPPTEVAHRVQVNADPNHYTKWWAQAGEIVQALGGTDGASCETTPGVIGTDGWAMPGAGPVNSPYGTRPGPYPNHTGTDFEAGGCGGPIWAAKDGTVTFVGLDSLQNGVVYIDHGNGLETRYVHMYVKDILVKEGQKVRAGEQIAKTGSSGASTGCHLHFEVLNGGQFTDPIPVLAAAGITY